MATTKQAIVPWQCHSCGVPVSNPEYPRLGLARRRGQILSLVSLSTSLRLDLKVAHGPIGSRRAEKNGNNFHWAVPAILLFGVCLAVSGCSNYLVSIPPPPLSATELIADPSPLAVGLVIPDELRSYQVVQKPWANVAYTFQLGQSLSKTIEANAQRAFTRAVPLKVENPWEPMRQEKLDCLVMVTLENAVVDAKRVGTFSQRGVINVRVALRVRVYDPSKKLLEEKILVGEGASNRPANSAWGSGTWGNSGPDTFTPGVEIALQDIGRKFFRYCAGLKG